MAKKQFVLTVLAALVASLAPAHAAGKLNVYNWNDYIGDKTVPDFEKAQDIKVKYDVYDSNETLQAKLMTGKSGYDLVVPSLEFAAKQIQSGVYLPLDKSKLPNYANLNPEILKKAEAADPGNKFLVPYMWGTTAFGINVDKVKKALGSEPMPADEWELIFNPKYTSKLKSCGISFMDTGSDVYSMVNIYLGKDANDHSEAALKAATDTLKAVRKDVRLFNSSPIDLLANGDVCVAMSFNGDTYIAKDRAEQAKKGLKLEYIVPSKGTILWVDNMAIPKDAKNVDNAYKWINNILDPKVAADISNKVNYANPNLKATPFVNKTIAADPKIYLTADAMAKLQAKKPIDPAAQKAITKYFNLFKTAK
ncbi:polyamine ABC transporter substrate-binding protein [Chitinimonas arctica]|uniref:Putrescine-binding periplasmic protein n=1 Tax=Chitinimonas arctica TaxID=2594795 RepID=A0A516SHY2_9NEIS|nr:polyamine ABC transporter substrate-binding protein [Chitinimonas arctica]QDQ27767.1 polyamine ABC transporter substrate-binding protein [Chitinimonas arctica]